MLAPKILLDGDSRLAAFPEYSNGIEGGRLVVGWREWAGLPGLGIARVQAKIDTGARTSSLHANSIEVLERDGVEMVRFDVVGEGENAPWHEASVADRRQVRSSNGEAELRFVIRTDLSLGGRVWTVEITLTNRERMEAPMLIGREALASHVVVDPSESWFLGRPDWRSLRPRPRRKARSGERT